ncbi:ABC transporter permease [Enterococcus viikkiensis]|uniref:ABC transporter permease n=1 Tax=Enterococcus viikkiensis TaxID=930854 RepID=UPI0010F652F5|nr:ABC transporter permease subunit [Enterococcus viikkiensis]
MKTSEKISPLFLSVTAFLILLPLSFLVLWSISSKWLYPAVLPQQLAVKPFIQMIHDSSFLPAIMNSFVIAFATTFLTLVIALPAANYFAFQQQFSQRVVEVMIYLPLILPAVALITSSQVIFLKLGLNGSFFGVVLIHTYFCLPYGMQILLESYRQLGEGYRLTARSLGASRWLTFWQISWPLLRPGIATSASLVFIVSFSQYLPTFFIGGGRIVTLPLLLLPYANNGRYGIASAYSLLFLVCTIIGVLFLRKLIGGVQRGTKR